MLFLIRNHCTCGNRTPKIQANSTCSFFFSVDFTKLSHIKYVIANTYITTIYLYEKCVLL